MKVIAMIAVLVLLVACGGTGGAAGKNESAADACEAYAKGQIGDKPYALDRPALVASMKDAGDGSFSLHAPITIEPGLATEFKETMECTVRFTEGKPQPDVIKLQFVW
jgi:hypothetical protein